MNEQAEQQPRRSVVSRMHRIISIAAGVLVILGGFVGPVGGPLAFGRPDPSRSFANSEALQANPNPIPVCDGSGRGQTTLSWNAQGVTAVEIKKDGEGGPLVASGASSGSAVVDNVPDFSQYYLFGISYRTEWQYNRSSRRWVRVEVENRFLIDELRVGHTSAGCSPRVGSQALQVGLNTDGGTASGQSVTVQPGGTYFVLASTLAASGSDAYEGLLDYQLRFCELAPSTQCNSSTGAWGDYAVRNGRVEIQLPSATGVGVYNVKFKPRGANVPWSNEVAVTVARAAAQALRVSVNPGTVTQGGEYTLTVREAAGRPYTGLLDHNSFVCQLDDESACGSSTAGAWGSYRSSTGQIRVELPNNIAPGVYHARFRPQNSSEPWSNEIVVRVEPAVVQDRLPQGRLETATCDTISGWAYDPDAAQSIDVHLYDGNTFISGHSANRARPDRPYPVQGDHGFSILTPAALKDGRAHTVKIFAINNTAGAVNPEITASSQTVQCLPSYTIGGNTFTIGTQETVATKAARDAAGLIHWADGQLGALNVGNGQYEFYTANSTKTAHTRGTLANPIQEVVSTGVAISGLKEPSNYASGGPVYKDPATGKLVLIYHAEKWLAPSGQPFHSWLGMAVSSDGGVSWTDLGRIISAGVSNTNHVEIGSGSYAIKDGYMYIAFHDFLSTGEYSIVTFARATVAEVAAAIAQNRAPEFKKLYNGAFTEPGVGGRSTERISNSPAYGHLSLSYNTTIQKFILVSAKYPGTDPAVQGVYISTSSDAVNWTEPTFVQYGNWMIYTTQIGTGADTRITGNSFYIYYMYYTTADTPWNTAVLMRQLITVR